MEPLRYSVFDSSQSVQYNYLFKINHASGTWTLLHKSVLDQRYSYNSVGCIFSDHFYCCFSFFLSFCVPYSLLSCFAVFKVYQILLELLLLCKEHFFLFLEIQPFRNKLFPFWFLPRFVGNISAGLPVLTCFTTSCCSTSVYLFTT